MTANKITVTHEGVAPYDLVRTQQQLIESGHEIAWISRTETRRVGMTAVKEVTYTISAERVPGETD